MSTVLGIDLGTQSVKVVFYDFLTRETVAVESAPPDKAGEVQAAIKLWRDTSGAECEAAMGASGSCDACL